MQRGEDKLIQDGAYGYADEEHLDGVEAHVDTQNEHPQRAADVELKEDVGYEHGCGYDHGYAHRCLLPYVSLDERSDDVINQGRREHQYGKRQE